ncbi:MAG: Fe-S protein assembly chaperone HscA [Nitrospiraceae bacterium]|nr:Fe-S protein assembly chaperone HscA [Nitrospiraceae bacterium]MDA8149528.1 Fe-S protein assembly chaperone HscA [Nitrospiraceae bacterium]
MTRTVIGIDLGTTNSLVAIMEDGKLRVIPDTEGRKLLPSVVALSSSGVQVGFAAKSRLNDPETIVVYSAKRLMGRSFSDVEQEIGQLAYPVENVDGLPLIPDPFRKRHLSAPQIGAMILSELRKRAEVALGQTVTDAVITVPAYFNDAQRQATKDAGEMAGLNVLRILNEPTSAALAYGFGAGKDGLYAVYDLGGGTFDFSLLSIRRGVFEVKATSGDTHLGGDDFDQAIIDQWLGILPKGVDQSRPEVRDLLRKEAEKAKIALSQNTEVAVSVPAIGLETTLSRETMNKWVEPLVQRTLIPVHKALSDAGVLPGEVDGVILVGGATRLLRVKEAVEELFRRPVYDEHDPDLVVGEGAAVQGDILSGSRKDMLLLDVTPLSLGIETMGGVMSSLIPRNTTIPTQAKELFTTFLDGQVKVDIHVLQGEREMAKDNRSLARFSLTDITPMTAGAARIEVTFTIDANGILDVRALDQRTGRSQGVVVHPSYGISKDTVREMIKESFQHAQEDFQTRMLIDSRTEATTVINATRRALEKLGPDILPDEERSMINKQLDTLEKAVKGEDAKLIRDETSALDQVTRPLAERLMNTSVQDALGGKSLPEPEREA